MSDFFLKVKKITDQLEATDHIVTKKEQIRVLLTGVGADHD